MYVCGSAYENGCVVDGICAIYGSGLSLLLSGLEMFCILCIIILYGNIMYPYIGKCNLLPENEGIYSYT